MPSTLSYPKHLRDVPDGTIDQADVEVAGRSEVALVGKIRALAHIDRVDRFRISQFKSEYPCPWACVRRLIGTSSTVIAMSVP